MASIASARRYAQAVLELGLQNNDLDVWRRDLQTLGDLWDDPGLRAFLEDVRIAKHLRVERARDTLGKRIGPLALNMLLLLISRGRSFLIPYIARQFVELERQREQTVIVHVTSVVALTDGERADLAARMGRQTGKDVQLEEHLDPGIMGGLVIKVGDQLLDLSVAGKLRRMREQIVGRPEAARG